MDGHINCPSRQAVFTIGICSVLILAFAFPDWVTVPNGLERRFDVV